MIGPETVAAGVRLTAGIRIVRAEEAWEPVLLGGMIPIIGAGAIFWLIRYAIKEPPRESEAPAEETAPGGEPKKGGGPGDPDPPPR